MTRYIVKKTNKSIVVEKRNSDGVKVICKTQMPFVAESVIAKEANKMSRLGIKFQIENRTNIHMDV